MARLDDDESPLARRHGKRKRAPRRWGLWLGFTLLLAFLGTVAAARVTFTLIAPHRVSASSAVIDADMKARLDSALDIERPLDRDQAIRFALDFTEDSLGRGSALGFGASERYASLFVVVFEASAKKAGSTARAWPIRSQLRVFDHAVTPHGEHTWVLVHDPADGARIDLDPLLDALWLSGNITRNVKGGADIALPP